MPQSPPVAVTSPSHVLAGVTILMARFRNGLTSVEERLHVQAWQLRQLVPEQVQAASAAPLPRSMFAA